MAVFGIGVCGATVVECGIGIRRRSITKCQTSETNQASQTVTVVTRWARPIATMGSVSVITTTIVIVRIELGF